LIAVTDADGALRRIERDSAGRVYRLNLPHPTATAVTPFVICTDRNDRVVRVTSPASRTLSITRDELGRSVATTGVHGSSTVASYQSFDRTNDSRGRLSRLVDASGIYEFGYDDYGRTGKVSVTVDPSLLVGLPNYPDEYQVVTTYGNQSQMLTSQVTGDGVLGTINLGTLSYVYDDFGRPIILDSLGVSPAVRVAQNVQYEVDNQIRQARLGNGLDTVWSYDSNRRHLSSIEYSSGASRVARVAYSQVDNNGNIGREQRWRGTSQVVAVDKAHQFDVLDRLSWTQITDANGARSANMTYSAGGRILTSTGDTYSYLDPVHVQAPTVLDSATLERDLMYDADGWLDTEARRTVANNQIETRDLVYDGSGCLIRVDSKRRNAANQVLMDRTTTHVCGPDGSRVMRQSRDNLTGAVARTLKIPGAGEIRVDEGIFVRRPSINSTVVYEESRDLSSGARLAGDSGYVLHDMRGSVLARTQMQAPGTAVTREADFDAWGNRVPIAGSPFPRYGFGGEEYDPSDGYLHFGRRVYDPTLRRWLSPDPLLLLKPEIDVGDGRQLNLYAYAANNPVSRTDRSGTVAPLLVLAAVGAAAESAIDFVSAVSSAELCLQGNGYECLAGAASGVDFFLGPNPIADFAQGLSLSRGNKDRQLARIRSMFTDDFDPDPDPPHLIERARRDATKDIKKDQDLGSGSVYKVPPERTPSGKPYVGTADDMETRAETATDGRERKLTDVNGQYDLRHRNERREAEQDAIDDAGGLPNLDNKRNEIAPKKQNPL
jgi:RHS repeat-associated protein